MSGRQSKFARREIRRSAAPALRTMQEQQEGAIMSCIQRVNELTMAVDVMRATLHNLGKSVDALHALRPPQGVIPFAEPDTLKDYVIDALRSEALEESIVVDQRSAEAHDALLPENSPYRMLAAAHLAGPAFPQDASAPGPDGDSRPLEAE